LRLISYVHVHAALDIVVLSRFHVPASAVYIVFVVNVFVAIGLVSLVFWVFDRLRREASPGRRDEPGDPCPWR